MSSPKKGVVFKSPRGNPGSKDEQPFVCLGVKTLKAPSRDDFILIHDREVWE